MLTKGKCIRTTIDGSKKHCVWDPDSDGLNDEPCITTVEADGSNSCVYKQISGVKSAAIINPAVRRRSYKPVLKQLAEGERTKKVQEVASKLRRQTATAIRKKTPLVLVAWLMLLMMMMILTPLVLVAWLMLLLMLLLMILLFMLLVKKVF